MKSVQKRERRSLLTGGMILIALGVLVILHKTGVWGFSQSWPLLLIVIAVGTLIQQVKDLGGWVIGSVGFVFLLSENIGIEIWKIVNLLLPALLILVGLRVLQKYFRKKREEPESDPPETVP